MHDDFHFYHSLRTNTTGEVIFDSLNDIVVQNIPDMNGRQRGLVVHVRAGAPLVTATHCCIHQEQLAVKKMPPSLNSAVQLLNSTGPICKGSECKALNTHILKDLCEETGTHKTSLSY